MRVLGDRTLEAMGRLLDRLVRSAAVTASNLANAETPGYRALEVRFPDLLRMHRADVERTHPRHLQPPGSIEEGRVQFAPVTRARPDGNTVDVEREMMRLGELQGRYRATTEMLRKRFALFLYAATDGRFQR